jgi:hypothetical protein
MGAGSIGLPARRHPAILRQRTALVWHKEKALQQAMKMAALLLPLLLSVAAPGWAQQTIFNVPSADTVPEGEVFLQHESQFRPWNPGRFLGNTEYAAVGVGHHLELDATLFNVNAPSTDNIALGLGFKKVFPVLAQIAPEREYKLTLGEMVPISLQGEGVGSWTYGHVSGRLPILKTRLLAGVSAGTRQIFGRNAVAFMGGYEQPVTKRLSLQGDWYSGTHNLGLFITGFSYALPGNTTLYAGYQIPNSKRSGSQGFVVELGKYF